MPVCVLPYKLDMCTGVQEAVRQLEILLDSPDFLHHLDAKTGKLWPEDQLPGKCTSNQQADSLHSCSLSTAELFRMNSAALHYLLRSSSVYLLTAALHDAVPVLYCCSCIMAWRVRYIHQVHEHGEGQQQEG